MFYCVPIKDIKRFFTTKIVTLVQREFAGLKDISTPDFSTPSFNPRPFNPGLFNPKSGVEKSGVGKFMVE